MVCRLRGARQARGGELMRIDVVIRKMFLTRLEEIKSSYRRAMGSTGCVKKEYRDEAEKLGVLVGYVVSTCQVASFHVVLSKSKL